MDQTTICYCLCKGPLPLHPGSKDAAPAGGSSVHPRTQMDGLQAARRRDQSRTASPGHTTNKHHRRLRLNRTKGGELPATVAEAREAAKSRTKASTGFAGAPCSHPKVYRCRRRGEPDPLLPRLVGVDPPATSSGTLQPATYEETKLSPATITSTTKLSRRPCNPRTVPPRRNTTRTCRRRPKQGT